MKNDLTKAFLLVSGIELAAMGSIVFLSLYFAAPAGSIFLLIGGLMLGVGAVRAFYDLTLLDKKETPKIYQEVPKCQ